MAGLIFLNCFSFAPRKNNSSATLRTCERVANTVIYQSLAGILLIYLGS